MEELAYHWDFCEENSRDVVSFLQDQVRLRKVHVLPSFEEERELVAVLVLEFDKVHVCFGVEGPHSGELLLQDWLHCFEPLLRELVIGDRAEEVVDRGANEHYNQDDLDRVSLEKLLGPSLPVLCLCYFPLLC